MVGVAERLHDPLEVLRAATGSPQPKSGDPSRQPPREGDFLAGWGDETGSPRSGGVAPRIRAVVDDVARIDRRLRQDHENVGRAELVVDDGALADISA